MVTCGDHFCIMNQRSTQQTSQQHIRDYPTKLCTKKYWNAPILWFHPDSVVNFRWYLTKHCYLSERCRFVCWSYLTIVSTVIGSPAITTGWWYTYPSEKYESQIGVLFPIWWESHKIHVPNHQPVVVYHCWAVYPIYLILAGINHQSDNISQCPAHLQRFESATSPWTNPSNGRGCPDPRRKSCRLWAKSLVPYIATLKTTSLWMVLPCYSAKCDNNRFWPIQVELLDFNVEIYSI